MPDHPNPERETPGERAQRWVDDGYTVSASGAAHHRAGVLVGEAVVKLVTADEARKRGFEIEQKLREGGFKSSADFLSSLALTVEVQALRIAELEDVLRLIAETDPIDAALDPQRAVRVATEVLATKCAHCDHAIEKDPNGTWLHSVTFDGRLRAEACEPDMQSMLAQPVDM